jgi:hypothetical protein
MPWVVQTVQEVVDDIPLALDTSNIDAIEASLKVIKPVAVRPERYERMVPIAAEHGADFIALMWGPEGLPRDENERAALCVYSATAGHWSDGIPKNDSGYRAGRKKHLWSVQYLQRAAGTPETYSQSDLYGHASEMRHGIRDRRSRGCPAD